MVRRPTLTIVLLAVAWLVSCGRSGDAGSAGSAAAPATSPSSPQPPSAGDSPGAPTPPAAAPPAAPDAVAREYLSRGTREADVRDLVDPACQSDRDTMSVDAVRMLGTPVRGGEVTVEPPAIEGERATVRFTVTGSLSSSNSQTTIGGAQVKIGGLSASGTRMSGSVRLARIDGAWKITCTR